MMKFTLSRIARKRNCTNQQLALGGTLQTASELMQDLQRLQELLCKIKA